MRFAVQVCGVKRVLDYTDEDWNAVTNTYLTGAWIVAQEPARHMVAADIAGNIVNITSILASRVVGASAPISLPKPLSRC